MKKAAKRVRVVIDINCLWLTTGKDMEQRIARRMTDLSWRMKSYGYLDFHDVYLIDWVNGGWRLSSTRQLHHLSFP